MNILELRIETWGVSDISSTLLASEAKTLGSGNGGVWELLGLLFLFCIILFGAWYVSKVLGTKAIGLKNKNISVIETYRVSVNSFIQIIKVADKYLVIAVGKDNIRLLTELDEDNVIIPELANNADMKQFKEFFENAKNKLKTKK